MRSLLQNVKGLTFWGDTRGYVDADSGGTRQPGFCELPAGIHGRSPATLLTVVIYSADGARRRTGLSTNPAISRGNRRISRTMTRRDLNENYKSLLKRTILFDEARLRDRERSVIFLPI